ncbi:MAG: ABC transporter permease [Bacteroidetes bacterium]|nr:ABC transporter permease [Bacteroidota bacterium]
MNKLFFSAKKEVLLIVRDVPGLLILFLMPVLLMTVVIMAQEFTLRNEMGKTRLLFIDDSHTGFSNSLHKNLLSSGFFDTDTLAEGKAVTKRQAAAIISTGKYSAGLYIGPGDSAIEIISDPALSGPYRSNLVTPLKYLVRGTQTSYMIEEMLAVSAGDMKPLIDKAIEESTGKLPVVRESFAGSELREIKPTAIQNIVPGFILFAMFFIVIPLAASIISEKNEGAFQRLHTLPVGYGVILGSKVLVYFIVCMIQFLLMMLVGLWIFPNLLQMPPLQVGNNGPAILFATTASSLAAIGFGILVGSAAGTMAQASLFGSVMVVLLGVISGTFLPVHVMPRAIQMISVISPMRWGIDNYLDVFIRGGGIIDILPRSLLLFTFFIFAMITSIYIFAVRKTKF